MKTLFAKTLLWFLGTAILTMAAIVGASALNFNEGGQRPGPFGMLLRLQLSDARHAYETGGKRALAETLERFRSVTHADGIFTDSSGRDLVTGEDRSDLLREAEEPGPTFPRLQRGRTLVARQSRDGKYWYFLFVNRGNWITWFVRPENNLVVLPVLILLCYAFARHLTSPVKKLQLAVDRFGRGDLTARVGSRRRDELGQLARTFDQMADRLQVLLTAERRLLMDISHELRSPLARLSVAVELARSGEDAEAHLNRIEKEADRLNSLVGELLQVTRAEGDPSLCRREQVPLDLLVAEVVDDCAIEAEARGCRLQLSESTTANLAGDAELLRRAVENVVRNAIRHAPPGTAVEVTLKNASDKITVAVRDYGPGVPADSLARIFDPFYRVDSDRNRNSGGVGLGLAIAKRAVELHQGRLWATNVNPGLLVTIELPLKAATSPSTLSHSLAG